MIKERFLSQEFFFQFIGVVAALSLFERITPLVKSERLVELLPIFQCFAECEAEMDSVGRIHFGGRFLRSHLLNLFLGKSIGFEVGEAPVSVTIIRLASIRSLVRGDRV